MSVRWSCPVLALLFTLLISTPLYAATHSIDGDIIGSLQQYKVKEVDNLYAIARHFDIGIVELLAANPGVDVWEPKADTNLTITTSHVLPSVPHEGIVLNLSELRLFYFVDKQTVLTFPIGIGREGWQTPRGITKILRKRIHPIWTPPVSIRAVEPNLPESIPPGPDNPLGNYALDTGWRGVLIHGTNRPYGVGKRSSHGCIRLYPEDIEALFTVVKVGTSVTVIDMPYKLGWQGDTLFLEVTPTQNQADAIAEYRRPHPIDRPETYDAIRAAAGDATIDWYNVDRTITEHSGIPVAIGSR